MSKGCRCRAKTSISAPQSCCRKRRNGGAEINALARHRRRFHIFSTHHFCLGSRYSSNLNQLQSSGCDIAPYSTLRFAYLKHRVFPSMRQFCCPQNLLLAQVKSKIHHRKEQQVTNTQQESKAQNRQRSPKSLPGGYI